MMHATINSLSIVFIIIAATVGTILLLLVIGVAVSMVYLYGRMIHNKKGNSNTINALYIIQTYHR